LVWVTLPVATICLAASVTWLLGMAKPIPAEIWRPWESEPERVGMPMTCPLRSTSAPPELPGLIRALVWTRSVSVTPLFPSDWVRPVALTMPSVTVSERPKGLPIASTTSPTWILEESANVAGVSPPALATLITARSLEA